MKKIILGLSITAVFGTACNSEIVHNKIKDNMYKSCIEKLNGQLGEDGDSYCKCAAEEMMKGRTTQEIIKLEKEINEGKFTQEQIVSMVQPCINKLQSNVYGSAKAANSSYKQNFIKVCTESMKGDSTPEKEQEYCSCSADAVVNALTEEELMQLDNNPDDTQLNEKVNDAIANCLQAYES